MRKQYDLDSLRIVMFVRKYRTSDTHTNCCFYTDLDIVGILEKSGQSMS